MSGFPQNSAMKILKLKSSKAEKRLEVWLEAGVMFLVKFMRRNDWIDSFLDFPRFWKQAWRSCCILVCWIATNYNTRILENFGVDNSYVIRHILATHSRFLIIPRCNISPFLRNVNLIYELVKTKLFFYTIQTDWMLARDQEFLVFVGATVPLRVSCCISLVALG